MREYARRKLRRSTSTRCQGEIGAEMSSVYLETPTLLPFFTVKLTRRERLVIVFVLLLLLLRILVVRWSGFLPPELGDAGQRPKSLFLMHVMAVLNQAASFVTEAAFKLGCL